MNSPGTNEATNARPAKDAGTRRLGRRLTLGVVLVSTLVTSVITVFELYRQYRMEVDEITRQFISINRSMVPALAEAVWVGDPMQIRTILGGLVSLRDVESATVMAEGGESWSAGVRVSKRTLVHAVPLHRSYKGSEVAIGRLEIVASVDNVYDRLWNMLLVTLASNAVKTALVVFFMLYLFQRLVGRHLQNIARHVIGLESDGAATLALEREPGDGPWRPDILDEVVAAVNQANEALSAQRAQLKSQVTALRASEERYRTLVEQAADAIFIAGPDGRFREANTSACEMFGYTRDEFAGLPTAAVVAEHETARQAEAMCRVLAGERVAQQRQFRRKDGRLFPGEIVAGKTGGGLLLAIVRDITARKETEEERQKFVNLANSSSEFIGMCDLDMKPLYVNPAGVRMVGLPDMAAACRVKVREYFFPEDQRFIAEEFFPRVLREGHGDVEIRLRHFQTGEAIWMFYYLFSVRDADGKAVGWATVSRDITERRRAEEELVRYKNHLEELVEERTNELREANRHLQELDRLKSLFIASMSHELRTPLNSIIGFTGIILMGMSGEISAVQRKQLGMVKKSANHLLDLINDVIDVSKIETGKTDLFIEAFDLSELVLEVKESFSVAASEKGLNLEWETEAVKEVTSDRRRVKQILVNLIGNAVKFTKTGTVTILVSKTKHGVSAKVRDTGVGIEPEDMEMLFAAFSRIHIQGRPLVEGTGLGLYLSRRIATLLGGEITAESEPGKGSTFTLSLPLDYPEETK